MSTVPHDKEFQQAARMLNTAERHADLDILDDTAMKQMETLREQTR